MNNFDFSNQYFCSYGKFQTDSWDTIIKNSKSMKLSKNCLLNFLKEDQLIEVFICSGVVSLYFVTESGSRETIAIYIDNEFVALAFYVTHINQMNIALKH